MVAADHPSHHVAQAFISALNEHRWRDAVVLVDGRTQAAFRASVGEWMEDEARSTPADGDTRFASPLRMMGVADAAEAMELTAEELLARFAEALHPGNLPRHYPGIALDTGGMRITRTLLRIEPIGEDRARAWYRTEWWDGDVLSAVLGGEHALELMLTPDGWRIRDADLSGHGGGHILPPGR